MLAAYRAGVFELAHVWRNISYFKAGGNGLFHDFGGSATGPLLRFRKSSGRQAGGIGAFDEPCGILVWTILPHPCLLPTREKENNSPMVWTGGRGFRFIVSMHLRKSKAAFEEPVTMKTMLLWLNLSVVSKSLCHPRSPRFYE
jgi:hypothetical protein